MLQKHKIRLKQYIQKNKTISIFESLLTLIYRTIGKNKIQDKLFAIKEVTLNIISINMKRMKYIHQNSMHMI